MHDVRFMMMADLKPGDRIWVKGDWNEQWPKGCSGVITEPPDFAIELVADQEPWQGHIRVVQGREGPIPFVWVVFDEPQMDGGGDGPYSAGETPLRLVTRMEEPNKRVEDIPR